MPKITLAVYRQCRYFPTTEMSDETRICKTCGAEKPITAFYRQGGVNNPKNRVYDCSKCFNSKVLLRRYGTEEKKEKWNATRKRWKAKRQTPSAQPEYDREHIKRCWKKAKEEFGDLFVADKLQMRISDIPKCLMEAKRAQLKLNRIIYEHEQN